jgi:LPXTG-motif cell wall-anchored protein
MRARFWISVLGMLAAACSFQQALDRLVSPERQAELVRIAQTLCRDPQSLQNRFAPGVFERSLPVFADRASLCPSETNVRWRVTNYNFNTASDINGRVDRRDSVLVVAGDQDGPWTEIQLNFQRLDDATPLIISWHIGRMTTRPPALAFIDGWEASRKWLIAALIAGLALLSGLVVWFIRRRKRQGKRLTDA